MPTLEQCVAIIAAVGAGSELCGGSWAIAGGLIGLACMIVRTDNLDREEQR